ncbi:acyltransferase family protein [Litchfieldella xinjiangensis]|uniref:acyltransferase family protein n=1 Tax=Litchfieldella xinjiangensis TaxID=1166948 RepID=UPI0005BACECF|nr:acyltransferase family protein [Halomonas xinjiangensis]
MEYRREIDGLRAVAVLPVILFHAGFTWFAGGYVGVDVFFVISGYLITTILINELESGTFSIAKFYERRARRILPALFFVMVCCIPFAWHWMLPYQFLDFTDSLIAVSLFSSNILFWRKSNYFAPAAEESPLLHTWSLAVEEQFYIFFPLLLLVLWGIGRRPLFHIILALSCVSLLLAEYGWRNHATATFYLLPTRAWELGAGALCAFLLHRKTPRGNQTLAAIGLGCLLFSIFGYDDQVPFPSVYTLLPVVGTSLIILFASKGTFTARLLSTQALVGIGVISFSAYLWHQPLFAFARIRTLWDPSWVTMASLSCLSIMLAYLSWKYIEQPFRTCSFAFMKSRAKIFATSAIASSAFFASGLYGHITNGADHRINLPSAIVKDLFVKEFNKECFDFSMKHIRRHGFFCTLGNPQSEPDLAIVGDSHALSFLGPFHDAFSKTNNALIFSGISGCPSLLNTYVLRNDNKRETCNSRNHEGFQQIVDKGITKVVLISRWTYYSTGDITNQFRHIGLEYDIKKDRNASFNVFASQLEETLRFFQEKGIEVYVFHQPPFQELDARNVYNWLALFGKEEADNIMINASLQQSVHDRRYQRLKETIDDKASLFEGVTTIDFSEALCPEGLCLIGNQELSYYLDKDHLSNTGAALVLAPHLEKFM